MQAWGHWELNVSPARAVTGGNWEIGARTDVELEALCIAMCISYSGRCLLSSYLTGRDGNRGACAGLLLKYSLIERTVR
ncbi:MAG: U32 family peptidase [Phascolarctobacterium faecium]